ncbi:hypothetical protein B9Z19DRAFT_1100065 [Tuber borchii]|uniref:Sodium/calcium exchanger membrane region domain-containing protein n=1 Tax=Tuber borchii TaxID=42251 RepID=A0A2T6ZZE0_TUBBO|nr:hypothetical protein B9Z19DRAFT_1100065 [Tuber borchii]
MLLVFAPVGIAAYCARVDPWANYSDSNAVKLIIPILALVKDEIVAVQASLVGTILGKLLLILGTSFIAGGYNHIEQSFNTSVAQTSSSILTLAVELGHNTAVILLFVYASYLLFQLKTHSDIASGPAKVEEDELVLMMRTAAILLVAWMALMVICSECLLDSIDHLWVFVGLILLQIEGNAVKHATAVTVAVKDKMDHSIDLAVGSSLETDSLVIALIVFQVMILIVSVLLYGKSNYLAGNLLAALYVIFGLACFLYPEEGPLADVSQ